MIIVVVWLFLCPGSRYVRYLEIIQRSICLRESYSQPTEQHSEQSEKDDDPLHPQSLYQHPSDRSFTIM